MRRLRLILGALCGLWISGCAGFQVNTPKHDKDVLGKEQRLLAVPFFADNTDQCGPSALASVLTFLGHPIEPPALKQEVYLADLKGSLSMDLLLAAQNHGFKAYLYNGDIEDLKSELRKGHPLVAFINRGFDFYPIGHYVVITGFDEERRGLYVHSGLSKNKFVSYRTFLNNWNKTERSTLLILPPGSSFSPPDTPLNLSPAEQFIEQGNIAFANGDLKKAAAFYRRVLRLDRNHAGANNNLAMVTLMSGKDLDKAEQYAQTALKQGGPLRPYVLETLASLYARQDRIAEAWDVLKEADAVTPADNQLLCDQLAKTRERLASL